MGIVVYRRGLRVTCFNISLLPQSLSHREYLPHEAGSVDPAYLTIRERGGVPRQASLNALESGSSSSAVNYEQHAGYKQPGGSRSPSSHMKVGLRRGSLREVEAISLAVPSDRRQCNITTTQVCCLQVCLYSPHSTRSVISALLTAVVFTNCWVTNCH